MKKRLLALLLVLVMVAGFIPVTARAEEPENLDVVTSFSFTFSINDSNMVAPTVTANPVKQDNGEYYVSVPAWAVSQGGSSLTIRAPESFTEQFSISYTSYWFNIADFAEDAFLSSSNGTIFLDDYFADSPYIGNSHLYSSFTLTIGEQPYVISLRPYNAINRLNIYASDNSTVEFPFLQKDDNTFETNLVVGTTPAIYVTGGILGGFTKAAITVSDTTPGTYANYFLYTVTDAAEQILTITVTDENYGIPTATYFLKINPVASDPTPILLNYNNAGGTSLFIQKDENAVITLETENTDENTVSNGMLIISLRPETGLLLR